MNGLHLIQYLKEASYPVTGTPLVAFLGDSVTHGAFECLQGAGKTAISILTPCIMPCWHASCAGLTTGSR